MGKKEAIIPRKQHETTNDEIVARKEPYCSCWWRMGKLAVTCQFAQSLGAVRSHKLINGNKTIAEPLKKLMLDVRRQTVQPVGFTLLEILTRRSNHRQSDKHLFKHRFRQRLISSGS